MAVGARSIFAIRTIPRRLPLHPAITDKTDARCVGTGDAQKCKVAIQTNNVEVDDRGYIFSTAENRMHTWQAVGARKVANLP
jgi:hypothetical protein